MATNLPDPLEECPPSTVHVYRELDWAGDPLSVAELECRTTLSTRTIQRATATLQDADLINQFWIDGEKHLQPRT